ncbi:uncharacterized protein LOC116289179 [Actinia tenebrosa]|uniref:Uncharacterized protein LOC116289179 n=1 Tax=Actinia tenebrosa TaxID=6105 RepID=A0A6P8H6A1_ACTTE|nr:uncharacterized protein LOC116289179 [Actinia tenebrosa]
MANEQKERSSRVVVAIDGSEHSQRAFDWYCENAHKDGDSVMLIHANDISDRQIQLHPYGLATVESWDKWIERCTEDSKKLLSTFEEKCKKLKYNCKLFTQIGNPPEVICKFAEEKDADHLIMGCRGQGSIRRTLMGSVSDYCVQHSHAPVTVVPPANREHHGFHN